MAVAVLFGRFDRRFDFVGELTLIVTAVEHGSDVLQSLRPFAPTEGNRLDLDRFAYAAAIFDDGEFLDTVRTGRVIEEPVAAEQGLRSTPPGRRTRRDHDVAPTSSFYRATTLAFVRVRVRV